MAKEIPMVWLKAFRWGDYPGLPRWAKCNHRVLNRRKAGGSESENATWGQEQNQWKRCDYSTEDGGRGQEPRDAVGL